MINKKEGLLLILLFFIIFQCNFVFAGIGITPSRIYTDFKPGEKFLVNFQALDLCSSHELDISAEGDFAEYVRFDKTHLKKGDYFFTAYIDLPEEAKKPGENMLSIQILEAIDESSGGIGARLGVGARVYIKVPYPGTYLEVNSFDIPDSNEGESINITTNINNFGTNPAYAHTIIEVYSEDNKLDSFDLGTQLIEPNNAFVFSKLIEGSYYKAGIYNATLIVDYGVKDNIELTDSFRVGRLFVDIIDWTKEFNQSKINKFNIEIESKWNNDIDNVYAEVNITNQSDNQEVDSFKTPSIYLKRWEKTSLEGFFNTEGLEPGKYKANIRVYYEGQITEKEVNIKVINGGGLFSSINKTVLVAGIIILLFIIMFIVGFIVMYSMLKKKLKGRR